MNFGNERRDMLTYKLYNSKDRCYLMTEDGMEFSTSDYMEAEESRWEYLRRGCWPNLPPYIICIHKFDNDVFQGEVLNIIMN